MAGGVGDEESEKAGFSQRHRGAEKDKRKLWMQIYIINVRRSLI